MTNCVSVVQICEYLKNQNYLDRFIQIGTSEMYGPTLTKAAREYDLPNPTSPYAVSKLAADMHLNTLFSVENFPMNIVRPSNCYGPGQYAYRIIPKAILYLLQDRTFPLEGGGTAEKSFMYISDLNDALLRIISSGTVGSTYNVGPGNAVSMRQIVEKICNCMEKDPETYIEHRIGRVGEDRKYWIDSSKIQKELNWEPKVSLDEGITKMMEWVSCYSKQLASTRDYFELHA